MDKIEIGAWNNLPHYSVVGHPQDFYVWVNEDGYGESSAWIKGRKAFRLYAELRSIKNKQVLSAKIKEVFNSHRKR